LQQEFAIKINPTFTNFKKAIRDRLKKKTNSLTFHSKPQLNIRSYATVLGKPLDVQSLPGTKFGGGATNLPEYAISKVDALVNWARWVLCGQ